MLTRITALVLAATLATPLAAQTSGTDETTESQTEGQAESTETQTEGAPAAGSAETGLSTGEAVAPAGPKLGEPYTREVSGDWELRCVRGEDPAQEPCQMYQLLKDGNGNAVSEVSIFRVPPGGDIVAGATVIVPLETLLTAQLTITVDGGNPRRYPFSFCTPAGCFARVGLTQADVNAFKAGAKAEVSIRPVAVPDQVVSVDMSLTGFTAGIDKASVIQPN